MYAKYKDRTYKFKEYKSGIYYCKISIINNNLKVKKVFASIKAVKENEEKYTKEDLKKANDITELQ